MTSRLLLLLCLLCQHAFADITIGVIIPMSGIGAKLGVPAKKTLALWPSEIGGETIKLIPIDDASNPKIAGKYAESLTTEQQVDILVGSSITASAQAIATIAAKTGTVHISTSPVSLPTDGDTWTFRIAPSNENVANVLVAHLKKHGIESVGFLGSADSYGETWLQDFYKVATTEGITIPISYGFERNKENIRGVVKKVMDAKPQAVLIAAYGRDGVEPHAQLTVAGFPKDKVYHTPEGATSELFERGRILVEESYAVSGACVVPEQLPETQALKKIATAFTREYEALYGANSRSQFACQMMDVATLLKAVIPKALEEATPGTPEFRSALKTALEQMAPLSLLTGQLQYRPEDHWGYKKTHQVVVQIANQAWILE